MLSPTSLYGNDCSLAQYVQFFAFDIILFITCLSTSKKSLMRKRRQIYFYSSHSLSLGPPPNHLILVRFAFYEEKHTLVKLPIYNWVVL